MNITTSELDQLEASKSEAEWNAVCDEIKSVHNGRYPDNWWVRVVQSGLAKQVQSTWK